jgi:hypothetical protein
MKMVSIDNDLFEELLEYAMGLRAEWSWKRQSGHHHHKSEFKHLSETINKGVAARNSNENNN